MPAQTVSSFVNEPNCFMNALLTGVPLGTIGAFSIRLNNDKTDSNLLNSPLVPFSVSY